MEMDSNSTGFFSRQDGAGWGDRSIQTHTSHSTALKPYGVDILDISSARHFHLENPTQIGIDKYIVFPCTITVTIVLGSSLGYRSHLNTTDGPCVVKVTNWHSSGVVVGGEYSRVMHLRAASSVVWASLSNFGNTSGFAHSSAT